jgi:hypothetical protein
MLILPFRNIQNDSYISFTIKALSICNLRFIHFVGSPVDLQPDVYVNIPNIPGLLNGYYYRGHVNKDIKDYRPKFLRTVQAKQSIEEVNLSDFLRQVSSTADTAIMTDLITRYNSENVHKASRRGRRDTLEHVTDSIMKDLEKDIEKELHGLQVGIRQLYSNCYVFCFSVWNNV